MSDLNKHPIHFLNFLRTRPEAEQMKLRFVTYSYTDRLRPAKKSPQPPAPDVNEFNFDDIQVARVKSVSYGVQTGANDREYFDVPLKKVNEAWLKAILSDLPEDRTFGFTGIVVVEKDEPSAEYAERLGVEEPVPVRTSEEFFVPVLDLKGDVFPEVGEMLCHFEYAQSAEDIQAAVYKTDASFHVYFSTLAPKKKLQDFLGRALLFNASGEDLLEEVIDTRWVGHSLVRDAATMRWSKKNENRNGSKLPALDPRSVHPTFLDARPPVEGKKSFRELVAGT